MQRRERNPNPLLNFIVQFWITMYTYNIKTCEGHFLLSRIFLYSLKMSWVWEFIIYIYLKASLITVFLWFRTILLNIPGLIALMTLACMTGLVVVAFYSYIACDPLANKEILNSNQVWIVIFKALDNLIVEYFLYIIELNFKHYVIKWYLYIIILFIVLFIVLYYLLYYIIYYFL